MEMYEQPPHTGVFIVRLWLEQLDDTRAEIRGEVRHVSSRERRFLRDWLMLESFFLEKLTVHTASDTAGGHFWARPRNSRLRIQAPSQEFMMNPHKLESRRSTVFLALAMALAPAGFTPPAQVIAQGTPPGWPPPMAKKIIYQDTSVTWLSFAPDGRTLAASGFDGAVRLWDVGSGHLMRTLSGHSASIWGMTYSPDGRFIFTGGDDAKTIQWDAVTGRKVREFTNYKEEAIGETVSPDGRLLYTGSGPKDTVIKVFDIATGKPLPDIAGHSDGVQAIVFTPDGKSFVSGSNDGTMKFWDSATRSLQRTLIHGEPVFHQAFSPDGKQLASAGVNGDIKLWDVATGKETTVIKAHTAPVYTVAYSSGGNWLASAGGDRAVRLWDPKTGKEIMTMMPFTDQVWNLAFSPNGKLLAAASADGSIRLFDVQFLASNLNITP